MLLHLGKPRLQAHDARLELVRLDHPFSVAVDQPTDAAAQAVDLAVKSLGLARLAGTMVQLIGAAPILGGEAMRVLQEGADQTANSRQSLRTERLLQGAIPPKRCPSVPRQR